MLNYKVSDERPSLRRPEKNLNGEDYPNCTTVHYDVHMGGKDTCFFVLVWAVPPCPPTCELFTEMIE